MKKNNTKFVDKIYKLIGKFTNAAPISVRIPTRNDKNFPLLWFDENQGVNRALRYARNQKSPFEDEQDGNVVLEPIFFDDGFLTVPKNNQVLQQFLYYHPYNGVIFEEVNKEKEASEIVKEFNTEVDALIEARQLSLDQVETVGRVLFGEEVSKISTAEIKRDILVFARKDPQAFLEMINDPELKFTADIQMLFDKKLLTFRKNQTEVWYNTPSNKKKMLSVPFGEDPIHIVGSFLQSDDGIEAYKFLKKLAKN